MAGKFGIVFVMVNLIGRAKIPNVIMSLNLILKPTWNLFKSKYVIRPSYRFALSVY